MSEFFFLKVNLKGFKVQGIATNNCESYAEMNTLYFSQSTLNVRNMKKYLAMLFYGVHGLIASLLAGGVQYILDSN